MTHINWAPQCSCPSCHELLTTRTPPWCPRCGDSMWTSTSDGPPMDWDTGFAYDICHACNAEMTVARWVEQSA